MDVLFVVRCLDHITFRLGGKRGLLGAIRLDAGEGLEALRHDASRLGGLEVRHLEVVGP